MFSIAFTDEPLPSDAGRPARFGVIQMDTERERFLASLSYWSVADYERQWRTASQRILEGHASAALITSLNDPRQANYIEWWPLYRVGESVFVQNQLLFLHAIRDSFNLADPYAHLSERQTLGEAGETISEWCITLADLEQFINGSAPHNR